MTVVRPQCATFPRFRLAGEYDLGTAPKLRSDLIAYAATSEGDVVCDCSDLTFLDSAAIGVLVAVRGELGRTGRGVRLAGVGGLRLRTLQVLGLVEAFGVNRDDA